MASYDQAHPHRIALFAGHYGSGKTNVAVSYARYLKKLGREVVIADLDIVNPYFRTKDSEAELQSEGIDVISLPFAGTNVDLPSIPSQAYSLVQNRARSAVLDIGGDDRGAYALGRFTPAILEENDYDCYFVVNFYRPLTPGAQDAYDVLREIESVSHIPFTAIVNDSNLGEESAPEDLFDTFSKARELSALSGLPVAFSCLREGLEAEAPEGERLFFLKLQDKIV